MRKYVTIFLLCFVALPALSQKSFFGVDAGINIANQRLVVSGPYTYSASFLNNLIKPTFGFFYHHSLSEKIGLRLGAQYMGLGYFAKSSPFQFYNKNSIDINYLTLPLSIHYAANNHLNLNAGVYLSFTVGGTDFSDQKITNTYHKNDDGFSFGAEHDVYKNFALGLNYIVGLKNIWLDDQGGTFKRTNRALQITVIYKFRNPIPNEK